MSLTKQLGPVDQLFHAYILVGDRSDIMKQLKKYLNKELGKRFTTGRDPDFILFDRSMFGIDDARNLRALESRRSFSGRGKYFIISTGELTDEAQNALLKTLEEPRPGNFFFILAGSLGLFFPTLLSRCRIVHLTGKGADEAGGETVSAEEFLRSQLAARLKRVEKMLKQIEPDRNTYLNFINQLETAVGRRLADGNSSAISALVLRSLADSAYQYRTLSLPPRLVLENLALVLPVLA